MACSIVFECGVPIKGDHPVDDETGLPVQECAPPAKGPQAHDHVPACCGQHRPLVKHGCRAPAGSVDGHVLGWAEALRKNHAVEHALAPHPISVVRCDHEAQLLLAYVTKKGFRFSRNARYRRRTLRQIP